MESENVEIGFGSLLVDEDFDEEMEAFEQDKTRSMFPCVICRINLRNSEEFFWHHKSHIRLPTIPLQRIDQLLKKRKKSEKKKKSSYTVSQSGPNNLRLKLRKEIEKCNPSWGYNAKINVKIINQNRCCELIHERKKDKERKKQKEEKKLKEPTPKTNLAELPKLAVQQSFLGRPYVIRNIFDQSMYTQVGQPLKIADLVDLGTQNPDKSHSDQQRKTLKWDSNDVPPLVPISHPRKTVSKTAIRVVNIKNLLSSPNRNQFESPLMQAPIPVIPESPTINEPILCLPVVSHPTFKCSNEKCQKVFYSEFSRDTHKESCHHNHNLAFNTNGVLRTLLRS